MLQHVHLWGPLPASSGTSASAIPAGSVAPSSAHGPRLPSMPTVSGARCKTAGVPPEPRARSDAATGRYHRLPGESSRQFQWRVYGVWRQRGGCRQDEFRRGPY